MRSLELLFLLALVLSGVALFLAPARRPTLLRYAPALTLTVALVHVFIDHGRWQLFVAYAAAGLLSLAAVYRMRTRQDEPLDRPWLRRLGGAAILLVTVASAAVARLIPIFSLPTPSGSYKVGTRWISLTDSTREETLSPESGDKRQLVVRLWFPADSVDGAADDYIEDKVARALATSLGFPSIAFSHLPLVATHSYRRAWLPTDPSRYPLILFSHGYGGTESQNTVQMEELASHGFVVASIDHPYEAAAIVMPGGAVLRARPPLRAATDTAFARQARELVERLQGAADTTALRSMLAEMYALTPSLDTAIARWTDDTRFVLERLAAMSTPHDGADTLLTGRLDTERVGLLGMSFGGATAANFCASENRCAAGMNLDGLLYGEASQRPLARPFFFASSGESTAIHRLFHERASAPSWLLSVTGGKHMDFSDLGWFAPSLGARAGILGGIAPSRMHTLLNAIVVPYFDAALRGGTGLDADALRQRFPEITLQERPGAPASEPSAPDTAGRTPR